MGKPKKIVEADLPPIKLDDQEQVTVKPKSKLTATSEISDIEKSYDKRQEAKEELHDRRKKKPTGKPKGRPKGTSGKKNPNSIAELKEGIMDEKIEQAVLDEIPTFVKIEADYELGLNESPRPEDGFKALDLDQAQHIPSTQAILDEAFQLRQQIELYNKRINDLTEKLEYKNTQDRFRGFMLVAIGVGGIISSFIV